MVTFASISRKVRGSIPVRCRIFCTVFKFPKFTIFRRKVYKVKNSMTHRNKWFEYECLVGTLCKNKLFIHSCILTVIFLILSGKFPVKSHLFTPSLSHADTINIILNKSSKREREEREGEGEWLTDKLHECS